MGHPWRVSWFLDDLVARAAERERLGLTRHLVPHTPASHGGLLDLAGNDYLGLLHRPDVIASAVAAARQYGGGAGASRLVTGSLDLHERLERELADLTGSAAALVFSTGYAANLGAVTALTDADTLIVSDAHVHASLIDAARLSRAQVAVAAHNDLADVERLLRDRSQRRAVVVVESVYSVLGDAAPLVELADLAGRHDAVLLVDEAHGLGVVGERGEGLAAALGLTGLDHVVLTATLSKSLAAQGGAVLGHPAVREHLANTARTFIYDTGLAPAAAGAALGALRALRHDPELPPRVRANAATLAEACGVDAPAGAVLSVPMPGPHEALAAVEEAAGHGIRIGCFRPPSTPDGTSRLRLTAHAHHTRDELALAAKVLREVTGRA
ncbi:8-amino-7-oxononanoate synthase [Oryzihumus leptocrescens]|uniref:8-amino-7-oxononanoate synthase n=1 Tax=Oryzihumus leptocrescens TaxID=297536 RepID=A0A542Z8V3_9MICO|nr:8-amino-7-oxononanoate synthase [Oryzihumus leptocrescens]